MGQRAGTGGAARSVVLILVAVTGLVGGVVLTSLVSARSERPASVRQERARDTERGDLASPEPATRPARALNEAVGLGPPAAAERPPAAAPEQPAAPSRELERERWRERFTRSIGQHQADGRDPKWARPTERLLSEDLASLGTKISATVVAVDCRTTSCSATLEWPTWSAAESSVAEVLQRPYRANCGTTAFLEDTSTPDKPYRSTVIFECTNWRADTENAANR